MASFTAGTTFVDGVSNDVTAAKLGALVTNATPTSGFIQDRTAETITATNDTLLIGDASDSNNLKRITVANFAQTLPTAKVTTGTIDTGTFGTTTSTAATITTGTIPTLVATTLVTTGTGTAAAPAIVPTGDTNTGIFFPAADTVAFAEGGTEAMRIDSSGNVGIGTTSPSRKLAIVSNSGDTQLTIGTTSPSLSLTNEALNPNTATQTAVIALATSAGAYGLSSGDVLIGMAGTSRGDLYLNSNYSGTGTTDVILQPTTGNVGIGTTTVSDKLHVKSGNIRIDGNNAGDPELKLVNASGGGSTSHYGIGTDGFLRMYVYDYRASAYRMLIDSNGNVGIGVTAPVNKLEVVGSFGRGAPVTKTGDFTLADTENWLIVNKGSSCTVTLPAASSWTGREFTIKVITAHAVVSASSNIIPRIGGAAAAAILPATDGAWATLVSNGTNWEIMCGS